MKLLEGIKNKGLPFEIQGCSRDELPNFFQEMGYDTGAEIGVYRGEFTEPFCKAGFRMYAIDPWIGYSGSGRTEKIQDKQNLNYEEARKRLSPFPNCTLMRKTSMDALSEFPDRSLDFVYIDGDHRFRYVAEDISEWFTKVRPGGVVSGHDYFCTSPSATNVIRQVKPVVDAFIETYNIESFYTFGTDRALSWMFIKPQ